MAARTGDYIKYINVFYIISLNGGRVDIENENTVVG